MEPWRVPLLRGKLPKLPATDGSAEEKGRFALCAMLLFRPHRGIVDAVNAWALPGGGLKSTRVGAPSMKYFAVGEPWTSILSPHAFFAEHATMRRKLTPQNIGRAK